MKSFKLFAVVAALASSLISLPSVAQTASLSYGTNSPVTCTYNGGIQIGLNGDVTIVCTTPVNTTGTGGGTTSGYTLSVNSSPVGAASFTCNGVACSASTVYPANTTVLIAATPALSYTLSGWTGCAASSSQANACSVTLTGNTVVTGTFTSSTTGGGTTAPPGVVMLATPPICGTSSSSTVSYNMGVTYSFALPKTSTGSATVATTPEGGIGGNAQWEVSISKTPGDWATAKTMAVTASVGGFGTTIRYPYYQVQSGQGGGMSWVPTNDGTGRPIVPLGETWYFNIRLTNMTGYITAQISSPGCN